MVMTELIAVGPEGRITPGTSGLHSDVQELAWRRIVDRIHIETINGLFLSKTGCNASGSEFGAGIKYAIEKGWLELHESGTYMRILAPGSDLLPRQ